MKVLLVKLLLAELMPLLTEAQGNAPDALKKPLSDLILAIEAFGAQLTVSVKL